MVTVKSVPPYVQAILGAEAYNHHSIRIADFPKAVASCNDITALRNLSDRPFKAQGKGRSYWRDE
jgi:hypothetical protein